MNTKEWINNAIDCLDKGLHVAARKSMEGALAALSEPACVEQGRTAEGQSEFTKMVRAKLNYVSEDYKRIDGRSAHQYAVPQDDLVIFRDIEEACSEIDRLEDEKKQQAEEIKRLKEALEEWLLHHWGLEHNDVLLDKSHCCEYCWIKSLEVLKIKDDNKSIKTYLEQALKSKENQNE